MSRKITITAAILALIWMFVPLVDYSATEIGFLPGDPDPNLHRTSMNFGAPLTWIIVERDKQESEGMNETRAHSFSVFHFIIHLTVIAVPIWLYRRISRNGSEQSPGGDLQKTAPQE